jgi:predicted small metal-binding protein
MVADLRSAPNPFRSKFKYCKEVNVTKVLTCRDVGVDCDFVARGTTVDEVMQKAAEHARTNHGYESIPPELAQKAKAAIRDEESATA